MDQVPIRALGDTASVLARVQSGESLEITDHGKLIARLVPVVGGDLDELVAAGKVAPATIHSPFLVPRGEVETDVAHSRAWISPHMA